ncbi:MAG: beta-galactosidase [Paracoccaceae bacterium]
MTGAPVRPRALGVCYYPEHWAQDRWADDAAAMVEVGLTWVRIGEFAWSLMEPAPGRFDWAWLDRAVETLGSAGLKVVLGTPTATPPRWMLDRHPDMLAVDAEGRPRKFGSRRHYCFSHLPYRAEAARIAAAMADRYGRNPHVAAWQIDNEYACHDTTLSYSDAAAAGFRDWLAQRYQSPEAMNRAWGNVFWSMSYDDWSQVDPPNLTVTEADPAHVLAFRRYSSDQVVAFNRAQVDALRPRTDAPLIHNYMGRETSFDHWDVGRDLDVASWDSYPIGFLSDRLDEPRARKLRYLRQGDPDMQAFHHDLYRGVGRGRWWVMEQQPGPVNWAPHNPAPLPGMARLWAWEAFAHGAEAVLYFRWRQAPFAQEQMHAGLNRPDGAPAPALAECRQVADELAAMPDATAPQAPVALVFDYASAWAWQAQPQGAGFDAFALALDAYRACRRLGLDVDVVPPDTADLAGYRLLLAPGLLSLPDPLRAAIAAFDGLAVLGPRTDVKTPELSIPSDLGPGIPGVTSVMTETLPPDAPVPLQGGGPTGVSGAFRLWVETLEADEVLLRCEDGRPALCGPGPLYLSGWPDRDSFPRFVAYFCERAGIETEEDLPRGLRLRRTATHLFALNYAPEPVTWRGTTIPAAGVHWQPL